MLRAHRNNVLMLNLTAISLLCLMFLTGLYLYRGGNLLPAVRGEDTRDAVEIWTIWGIAVAVPAITAVFWVARARTVAKPEPIEDK